MERIEENDAFSAVHNRLDEFTNADQFVGRAPAQVKEFVYEVIDPILEENKSLLAHTEVSELEV